MDTFLRQSAEFLPILLQGLRLTIVVTVGSLLLSTVLGLLWALMRVSGVLLLAGIAKAVVNVTRMNTSRHTTPDSDELGPVMLQRMRRRRG